MRRCLLLAALALSAGVAPAAPPGADNGVLRRIRSALDAVPAVDAHDHLRAFADIARESTPEGPQVNLSSLWRRSYFTRVNPLPAWPADGLFATWWAEARLAFPNARATSFYRCMLPAWRDLYDVDFDTITDDQARRLDERIRLNYRNPDWVRTVIRKANIETIIVDSFWAPLDWTVDYPFTVRVLRTDPLVVGFHPSEFQREVEDPYAYARTHGLKVASLEDYLALLDRIFQDAKQAGIVGLKSGLAYRRSIRYENVPRAEAEAIFGKPRRELTPEQVQRFEDFIMWRLVELSARYQLPFQFHTGDARIQGSNPMLLVDLIDANPRTRFVLFHGGFPWVGETAAIAQRYRNVWIDSNWLPQISYTMAKRAYQEWLEVVPANRILWGADNHHPEGVYGATVFTRQCLSEALAEKVARGELREEDARRTGRQILRDNALQLFSGLPGSRTGPAAGSAVVTGGQALMVPPSRPGPEGGSPGPRFRRRPRAEAGPPPG